LGRIQLKKILTNGIIFFLASAFIADAQENPCDQISVPRADFEVRTDFARITTKWYPEWLDTKEVTNRCFMKEN
jgi:hypothetical protein